MIPAILLAFLLLALLLAAGPASAESMGAPLQLKSDITIEDRLVRLGDLFAGPVPGGERAVLEAPKPGESFRLDANWLSQLALAFNLPWRPASTFDEVRLTRAGIAVEPALVRATVASALAERGLQGDVGIDMDSAASGLAVSVGSAPTVALERFLFDPATGRFTATLVAPAAGEVETTRTVTGRAYALVDVPVLKRRVAPGEAITEADLTWITLPADRVGATVAVDAEDLLGKTPRRLIRAETPIRLTDLAVAVAVAKGSLVTIALQTANMQLTTQGRALQNGSIGETIRIMNSVSNRTLEAVVMSPSEVAVLPPTPTSAGAAQ